MMDERQDVSKRMMGIIAAPVFESEDLTRFAELVYRTSRSPFYTCPATSAEEPLNRRGQTTAGSLSESLSRQAGFSKAHGGHSTLDIHSAIIVPPRPLALR